MDPTSYPTFFTAVLAKLGLSATPGRLAFFAEWARYEGTGAAFNPLATTQPGGEDANDPYWNTFGDQGQYHVRNYTRWEKGIEATATTLLNTRYPSIIYALMSEKVTDPAGVASQLRTWGTTGFANEIAEGWTPWPAPAQPDEIPPPEPPPVITLESLRDYIDALNSAEHGQIAELAASTKKRHDAIEQAFEHIAEGIVLAQAALAEG